jgi:ferredoxin
VRIAETWRTSWACVSGASSARGTSITLDVSSPALVRDPDKCILCGKCVRFCEEIQGVAAIDFIKRGSQATGRHGVRPGLNVSSCINCGQCIMVCPTGALREQSSLEPVIAALADPKKFVVVQHAPAVSVTLAEEFGMRAGKDIAGVMTRRCGSSASTASSTPRSRPTSRSWRRARSWCTACRMAAAADADELLAGVDQVRRAVLPRLHR